MTPPSRLGAEGLHGSQRGPLRRPCQVRCKAASVYLLVFYWLFAQLLIQLLLQDLELGPGLCQFRLELRDFLGMLPILDPGTRTRKKNYSAASTRAPPSTPRWCQVNVTGPG